MKARLVIAGKLLVATLLVVWLLRSGVLDLGAVRLLIERPELLVASIATIASAVAIAALRWRMLLRVAGVRLTVSRALQLQLVGQFFNIVLPGGIGGDVIKAIYVGREVDESRRSDVYVVAFVDRLIGVSGLVLVALVAVAIHGRAVWVVPEIRGIAVVVAGLAGASLVVPALLLVLLRRSKAREITGSSWFGRLLGHVTRGLRLVSTAPVTLVVAVGLAAIVHLLGAMIFVVLATAVSPNDPPIVALATVYPLGMLTTMIPISYAGIGVGHLAFERLFALVGMTNGATAFNLYLVAQTAPCLVGVFPYLTLRRTAPPVREHAP